MTVSQANPSLESPAARPQARPRLHWHHLAILAIILSVAAFLRLDRITRTGLWGDEFQSLFLATGRGDAVMNIPVGVIVHSPPPIGFHDAPGIGHIWTSLDSTVHPPLYFIILRLWVDAFGDTDFSIRTMSALFGLTGIVLLFDAIRLLNGPWQALFGAAMMAFAPVQLDFGQQARPYTLVASLCLLMFLILIRIQAFGISPLKLILLFLTILAVTTTHYFAVGNILAAILYVAIRFKGKARAYSAVAMVAALLLFALVWGPIFWATRDLAAAWTHPDFKAFFHLDSLGIYLLDLPQRLTFGRVPGNRWPILIAMALLIYIVPLWFRGRNLIWYFWIVGSIAAPLAVDAATSARSMLVGMDKYVFLAAPGIYAILAAAMCGRLIAYAVCLGITIFGIGRWQAGPDFSFGSTLGLEDHRAQAKFLADHVQDNDLVILPSSWTIHGEISESSFTYFIIAHYKGEWKTPVLLLTTPLTESTRKQFPAFRRIWVAGSSPIDCERLLPDYPLQDVHATTYRDSVWGIK